MGCRHLGRCCIWMLIGFAGGAVLRAQPYINTKGVMNAASFMPPDLPAGAIGQGSVFAILGRELGPTTTATATVFPLGATLGGAAIKVFQGATSVAALPLSVTASRIYAIMPSNAPLGRVSVQVTVNGVASNPAPVTVVAASFGIFTANSLDLSNPQGIAIPGASIIGFGPGFAQNTLDDGSLALNSPAQTALPGQTVTLLGTGLGPVATPDAQAPAGGSPSTPVEVFVGGQPAQVSSSGRAFPGIDQVAFTVPNAAPAGCYVPVHVRVAGKLVSNAVTIAIDPDGNACADAANPLGAVLAGGGKFGGVMLARVSTELDFGLAQTQVTADSVAAMFHTESGMAPFFNPLFSLPPLESCTSYAGSGYMGQNYFLPAVTASSPTLDAGTQLSIATPGGTVNAGKLPGYPQAYVGIVGVGTSLPPSYTISVNGGLDVGPFAVTLTLPQPVTWINRAQAGGIVRASGFTVTWDAGGTDPVVIAGASRNTPVDSSAGFVCLAAAADGGFTVPAHVLANLPASDAAGRNRAAVFVGSAPIGNLPAAALTRWDSGWWYGARSDSVSRGRPRCGWLSASWHAVSWAPTS